MRNVGIAVGSIKHSSGSVILCHKHSATSLLSRLRSTVVPLYIKTCFSAVWNVTGSVDLSNVNCLELIWNNDQKTTDYVIINTKPLVDLVVICLLAEKLVVYKLIVIF